MLKDRQSEKDDRGWRWLDVLSNDGMGLGEFNWYGQGGPGMLRSWGHKEWVTVVN